MSARVVTVFGDTSAQGPSIVKALLADGTFTPRAVTRNPDSEQALRLKQLGVEVVQDNHWDITAFWDPKNCAQGPTSEEILGKSMVDAAIQAGVKFFVWSSLPHVTRLSEGKYRNVFYFDNKANVDDYLRQSQLPHTNLHTGWFSENLWNLNYLALTPDGSFERDLGQCVLALLKHYNGDSANILGQTFYAVSDKMDYTDYAKTIEKVLGKLVSFVTGPPTGMKEDDESYEFQSEFGMYPCVIIPNPCLERLGVQFHSTELFVEEELKKRYA